MTHNITGWHGGLPKFKLKFKPGARPSAAFPPGGNLPDPLMRWLLAVTAAVSGVSLLPFVPPSWHENLLIHLRGGRPPEGSAPPPFPLGDHISSFHPLDHLPVTVYAVVLLVAAAVAVTCSWSKWLRTAAYLAMAVSWTTIWIALALSSRYGTDGLLSPIGVSLWATAAVLAWSTASRVRRIPESITEAADPAAIRGQE